MAHDVIMPQLGMAQDAGLIVAWHKAPGDAVSADDVLMEVETDKATMEVPAGREGILVEIRVEAGTEVPVGNVVAVIAKDADEARALGEARTPSAPSDAPATAPLAPAAPERAAEQAPGTVPPQDAPKDNGAGLSGPGPQPAGRAGNGRILASPKARRLAAERGIDLAALWEAGGDAPILVADLDRAPAAAAPSPAAREAPEPAMAAQVATLTATASRSAFDGLLTLAGPNVSRAAAFAAFAAGAYRSAAGAAEVVVACHALGEAERLLVDPDRVGLRSLASAQRDYPVPHLSVVDLTGSRLTGYRAGRAGTRPVLAIANHGAELALIFNFDESVMDFAAAAAFLDDLAQRIEDPMRHLL